MTDPTPAVETPSTAAGRRLVDWTWLANVVRHIDGNHDLGAGEFAAKLVVQIAPFVRLAEREAREAAAGDVAALREALTGLIKAAEGNYRISGRSSYALESAITDARAALSAAAPVRPEPPLDTRILEWVAAQPVGFGDWACIECRPTSDMSVDGFRCVVHEARARLAAAERSEAEAGGAG